MTALRRRKRKRGKRLTIQERIVIMESVPVWTVLQLETARTLMPPKERSKALQRIIEVGASALLAGKLIYDGDKPGLSAIARAQNTAERKVNGELKPVRRAARRLARRPRRSK